MIVETAVIIEEIDKKYYALAFSKEKNITTIGCVKSWMGEESQFVRNEICSIKLCCSLA